MSSSLSKYGVALAALVLGAGLTVMPSLAAAKAATFTGEVGDVMCGAKHEMGGNPADCTRECAKQGSKYALISGDKVYTLETKDKATLEQLDKLSGQKATVTGTADGTTIQVSSAAASK